MGSSALTEKGFGVRGQRAQNVDAEFGGGSHQSTHVWRARRGAGWLTEFEHKVFKTRWSAEDQHVSWRISNYTEAVNYLARTEYEITFTRK